MTNVDDEGCSFDGENHSGEMMMILGYSLYYTTYVKNKLKIFPSQGVTLICRGCAYTLWLCWKVQ